MVIFFYTWFFLSSCWRWIFFPMMLQLTATVQSHSGHGGKDRCFRPDILKYLMWTYTWSSEMQTCTESTHEHRKKKSHAQQKHTAWIRNKLSRHSEVKTLTNFNGVCVFVCVCFTRRWWNLSHVTFVLLQLIYQLKKNVWLFEWKCHIIRVDISCHTLCVSLCVSP